MARIKGRDTSPELQLSKMLKRARRRFETHVRELPGRPDFVFRRARVAVFVDGDFWHGWKFESWRLKLSEKWETKIKSNMTRDARNRAKLRRSGWTVIRIWEHQIKRNPDACLHRILAILDARPGLGANRKLT
jgi:DNA mismatch endonuclease (patch repair protein)